MYPSLTAFGIAFTVVTVLLLVIPIARAREFMVTPWSLFLVGSINFIGISTIQTGLGAASTRYGLPSHQANTTFIVSTTAFYLAIITAYYASGFTRSLVTRRAGRWPPQSRHVIWVAAVGCLVLSIGKVIFPNIQFIGQLVVFLGLNASIFAVSFAVHLWLSNRLSLASFILMVVCIISAAVLANLSFGRREFLSVMLSLVICGYWLRYRYLSVARSFLPLMIGSGLIAAGIVGVSVSRLAGGERSANPDVGDAIEKLIALPKYVSTEVFVNLLGGDTTVVSLAAIDYYRARGKEEIEPFFYFRYVLSNPIPRAWYRDKPSSLGLTFPDALDLREVAEEFNVGPGPAGHAAQEGGWYVLVVYGVLFGFLLRWSGEVLVHRPDNIYVIAIFGAASGQIVAFPRGDIGVFTIMIIAALLSMAVVCIVLRLLFGVVLWQVGQSPAAGEVENRADGWDMDAAYQ